MNNRAPTLRHLDWDACYNVRDLGGLPTLDGGATRWGSIIRADILARLTETGRQALAEYGVRTVIDLRSPDQVAEEPSAFVVTPQKATDPAYFVLPVEAYYPHVGALINQAQSRAEVYCITLDHYPANMAAILRTIANAEPGAVVIHCHAGKDRTGVVVALLLALAGVPDEQIAADYAESQARLWPLYEQMVAEAGGEDKVGFWTKPTATPEMMLTTLAHLRNKYGGVREYLSWIGLTDTEIDQLRRRLRAEAIGEWGAPRAASPARP
jgi:protein-tyrosine phosphatase